MTAFVFTTSKSRGGGDVRAAETCWLLLLFKFMPPLIVSRNPLAATSHQLSALAVTGHEFCSGFIYRTRAAAGSNRKRLLPGRQPDPGRPPGAGSRLARAAPAPGSDA
jgi:hypothetical protein